MQFNGASIWISESRALFPAGLAQFNIDPQQIIFIEWYVYYHYLIPGSVNKFKMFKVRCDINEFPIKRPFILWQTT